MKNPFISCTTDTKREYLTSMCSLNRVVLAKLPIYGIEDTAQGKTAIELFGVAALREEIRKCGSFSKEAVCDVEKAENNDLLPLLVEQFALNNEEAYRIADQYGNRLGLILLTLKTGLPENRRAREDWDDAHWDYWAGIQNVIAVGGLASGLLGEYMIKKALEVFDKAGVPPYNIIRSTESSKIGALGCLSQIRERSKVNVLFDFGQTQLKRLIAFGNDIIHLDSMQSIYMECQISDRQEQIKEAEALHQYLVETIVNTYKEAEKYGDVANEVIISIANYVVDGRINDIRGGYAKLSELGDNYAYILSQDLERILDRQLWIKLIHDGTAVALYYAGYKDTVCITMGTAFGVGFPEIRI